MPASAFLSNSFWLTACSTFSTTSDTNVFSRPTKSEVKLKPSPNSLGVAFSNSSCNSLATRRLSKSLYEIFDKLLDCSTKSCVFSLWALSRRTTSSLRRLESLFKPFISSWRLFTSEFNSDSSESLSEASESILPYSSIFFSRTPSKRPKSALKSFLWVSSHLKRSSNVASRILNVTSESANKEPMSS